MPEKEQKKLPGAGSFPSEPGVYLMKDAYGRVIYVGKSLNLRARIGSYYQHNLPLRQKSLMSKVSHIEYIITGSEMEALVLEAQLIKEYQPRYNVNLKDDKDYPYLKITGEIYPRLELVRLPEKSREDGRVAPRYYGPYTQVKAVRKTLRFMGKLFPLRTCRQPLDGSPRGRPCLNLNIKRCLGPCRGSQEVSFIDYRELVNQVSLFLEGKHKQLIKDLKKKMESAAAGMDFESAAALRDRLQYLQGLTGTKTYPGLEADRDVLALIKEGDEVSVHMFIVREGSMRGQEHFSLGGTEGLDDPEILAGFMKNYYSQEIVPPREIILSLHPSEEHLLLTWLSGLRGAKISIHVPRRGRRRELVDSCLKNGLLYLREKGGRSRDMEVTRSLRELESITGLSRIERIEGYDISHLRGGEAVGSMVVFQRAMPLKEGYRRFRIRLPAGGDDLAALSEVFRRRLEHREQQMPDLILVDGGAAQLQSLSRALEEKGLTIPSLALAKRQEDIYLPGESAPLSLPAGSPALGLLQRVRDEAHRFALDYHRKLRRKKTSVSYLEGIPGIGKYRKNELMRHFGNLKSIFSATEKELQKVKGIERKLARIIYEYLHG